MPSKYEQLRKVDQFYTDMIALGDELHERQKNSYTDEDRLANRSWWSDTADATIANAANENISVHSHLVAISGEGVVTQNLQTLDAASTGFAGIVIPVDKPYRRLEQFETAYGIPINLRISNSALLKGMDTVVDPGERQFMGFQDEVVQKRRIGSLAVKDSSAMIVAYRSYFVVGGESAQVRPAELVRIESKETAIAEAVERTRDETYLINYLRSIDESLNNTDLTAGQPYDTKHIRALGAWSQDYLKHNPSNGDAIASAVRELLSVRLGSLSVEGDAYSHDQKGPRPLKIIGGLVDVMPTIPTANDEAERSQLALVIRTPSSGLYYAPLSSLQSFAYLQIP